jgi:hypothetical protein
MRCLSLPCLPAGEGPLAFCSGGDQSVRGKGGYVGEDNVPRLNVLDLQLQIRRLPKPVVAMVAGYAVGGGHILHMVCDLTVRVCGCFGGGGVQWVCVGCVWCVVSRVGCAQWVLSATASHALARSAGADLALC